LRSGVKRALADFRSDPAAAAKLLETGDRPMPDAPDAAELAAYAMAASVILNLDETVTRE